jgi:hypothetical protein
MATSAAFSGMASNPSPVFPKPIFHAVTSPFDDRPNPAHLVRWCGPMVLKKAKYIGAELPIESGLQDHSMPIFVNIVVGYV